MFQARSGARRMPSGIVSVCLAGVLWGTAPIAFGLAHDRTALTTIAISAYRLAIAALVLVLVTTVAGRLGTAWGTLRDRPVAVVAVGAGVAGYQALWFSAITHVGTSIATVISLGLAPVLVTGWENWRTRTRPSPGQVFVVVAAVVGLAMVSLSTGHPGAGAGNPATGLLLAIAAGVLYAVTTVLSRQAAQHAAPLPLTTATTAVGAVLLVPLAHFSGPVLTADPSALLALGYLGIVTMALGYLLLYAGLRTAPASAASVATLLEPATATVLAVILLAERLTPAATVGIVLILAAVAALNLRLGSRRLGLRAARSTPPDQGKSDGRHP